jgi:outer membrane protein W
MKKIVIIFMIAALHQFDVLAQDLIVTTDGDSINCKITQMKGDYVYFTFSRQGEVRNTLLSKTQVQQYQHNYYAVSEVQPHQIVGFTPDFSRGRLAFTAGWSTRTARFADGLSAADKEYLKNLKNGLNISLDAGYFFTEMYGIGFKYDLFHSSTTAWGFKETVSITYAGPTFAMRVYDRTKSNCLYINYSIGYMGFANKAAAGGQSGTLTGNTVGLVFDIGYDIAISKDWSFGIQLSSLSGVLTEINKTVNAYTEKIKLEKGEYEGLQRLKLSVGLRCNL